MNNEIEVIASSSDLSEGLLLAAELLGDEAVVEVKQAKLSPVKSAPAAVEVKAVEEEGDEFDGIRFIDMTDEQRRAYKSRKQAERRAKLKDSGIPLDTETLRQVLADAAINMIILGGEGSDRLLNYVAKVYADKPQAKTYLARNVRNGKIKKRVTPVAGK